MVLAVAAFLLRDYFVPRLQIILGMLAAPFVFGVKEKGIYSGRYGIAAMVFMVLFFSCTFTCYCFSQLAVFCFLPSKGNGEKLGCCLFFFW